MAHFFFERWIILGLRSCFWGDHTHHDTELPRHEQVWSPAGGWWPTPVAWKRNTAVAYLCIGVISTMIFKVSAEKERRPIEPFKPGECCCFYLRVLSPFSAPVEPSSSEPALVQAPARHVVDMSLRLFLVWRGNCRRANTDGSHI